MEGRGRHTGPTSKRCPKMAGSCGKMPEVSSAVCLGIQTETWRNGRKERETLENGRLAGGLHLGSGERDKVHHVHDEKFFEQEGDQRSN